jgi:pimeloyl-ACP methyl ester carboxylesterase
MKTILEFFWKIRVLLCTVFAQFVYFFAIRQHLSTNITSQIEMVFLGALIVVLLGAFLSFLVKLIALIFSKNRTPYSTLMRDQMIIILSVLICLAMIVTASQWLAHTPPILGTDGKPSPNSIASLEKVRLGGVDQWLIIRGEDVNKPVLLFLSGGPGASEAARVLRFNQELEKHFVVVIWEQRGCGKSYPSINPKTALTVDQYVSDLLELTEMLRARFDEQKIYLVGHSWGTVIGVRAAQTHPELFHAYVGTSQMVDVLETDQMIYEIVKEHSIKIGDSKFVETLKSQEQPPYYGKNPIKPYATLFGREYAVFEVPNIKDADYRRDGDILLLMLKQPEYGWLDRIYYLLGLMNTFNVVYPQMQEMDLRLDATHFELPVYQILGRNDLNNPYQIPEEYFHLLVAPSKQLYFFEESGHGMIWEEAEKFHNIMINIVLPETYKP